MKKVIVLTLLIVLSCNVVYADNNRWQFICYLELSSVYIDGHTWKVKKINNTEYLIDCWYKTYEKDSLIINHIIYYSSELSFLLKESNKYDNNGNCIASWDSSDLGWHKATPGTNIEKQLLLTNIWITEKVKEQLDNIKK